MILETRGSRMRKRPEPVGHTMTKVALDMSISSYGFITRTNGGVEQHGAK
jgi:hypothetical protein